jgi:hypothetical protein
MDVMDDVEDIVHDESVGRSQFDPQFLAVSMLSPWKVVYPVKIQFWMRQIPSRSDKTLAVRSV